MRNPTVTRAACLAHAALSRTTEPLAANERAVRVTVLRAPRCEARGLEEMWIADPDGVRIVLVEIPEEHPLRLDRRPLAAADE